MRRFAAVTVGVTLALSVAIPAQPALAATSACPDSIPDRGYADVDGANSHRSAINCVTWWEITSGSGFGTYEPAVEVRREQMATFLARLVEAVGGNLETYGRSDFEDVRYDNPHRDNIARLADVRLVQGTSPGYFSPGATVNRAQMATFLVRAAEYARNEALPVGGDAFDDDNGNPHEVNINKAAAVGFATGAGGRAYNPSGLVRRDQMATFMARVLNRSVEAGDSFVPVETITVNGAGENLSSRFRLRSGEEYRVQYNYPGGAGDEYCYYYGYLEAQDDDYYGGSLEGSADSEGPMSGEHTLTDIRAAEYFVDMYASATCPWQVTLTRVR